MVNLKVNPEYEKLIPKMSYEEYSGLRRSIKNDGQQYPIIVNEDMEILDGHNRYKACIELGIEPDFIARNFESKLEEKQFVIITNLQRRHLNDFQKAELGMLLLPIEQELAKQRQGTRTDLGTSVSNETFVRATEIIAKEIALSRPTFERARVVIQKAPEELKEKVRAEEISISRAYNIVSDADELEAIIENLDKGEFREKLEEKYLPKKFDKDALKDMQVEIFKEKGLSIEIPLFNADVVPLIEKLYVFMERYGDKSAIIECEGNAESISKALEEIKKLLEEDGLKHLVFTVKI
jgi:ParB-like chromosome segregation protein Spo0J